jgi:hypothetical protein
VKESGVGVACGRYGGEENVYMVFVGKHEGGLPLARPGCRWEDTINMNCKEI